MGGVGGSVGLARCRRRKVSWVVFLAPAFHSSFSSVRLLLLSASEMAESSNGFRKGNFSNSNYLFQLLKKVLTKKSRIKLRYLGTTAPQ